MINFLKNKKIQFVLAACFLFFVSFSVSFSEVEYKMLEKLPYINPNGEAVSLTTYLSGAFRLAFGVAILLAVFQISFGGFKYLTDEAFFGKKGAIEKINNAVYGLVLIFVSYLLLNFINPDLVNIRFEIPKVGGGESSSPIVPGPPKEKTADEIRNDYRVSFAPRTVKFEGLMEGSENNCNPADSGYEFITKDNKLKGTPCVYASIN